MTIVGHRLASPALKPSGARTLYVSRFLVDPSTIWPALSGAWRTNSDALPALALVPRVGTVVDGRALERLAVFAQVEPAPAVAQPDVAEIELAAGDRPLDLHRAVPRVSALDLVAVLLDLHEALRR